MGQLTPASFQGKENWKNLIVLLYEPKALFIVFILANYIYLDVNVSFNNFCPSFPTKFANSLQKV